VALYDRKPSLISQQMIPFILVNIDPPPQAAIPFLVRASRSTNEIVRNNAIYALSQVHADPLLVVPALIAALQDSVPNVRANAARSLAGFGKDAEIAVPALLQLWRQESSKPAVGPASQALNMIWGTSEFSP